MKSTTNFRGLLFFWFCFFLSVFFCCSQMQQKGYVSSCSSAGYCKLETRAVPLHGTNGRRGGGEIYLLLCEVVTDFVVTGEVAGWNGCEGDLEMLWFFFIFFFLVIEIFIPLACIAIYSFVSKSCDDGRCILSFSNASSPLPFHCGKTWRCELWNL